jgi:hypothetical protein
MMNNRLDPSSRPQLRLMPWWWAGVAAASSLVLGSLAWWVVWSIAKHNPTLQIEAIKVGLSVAAGIGGVSALLLAFRRQLHGEHVAQDISYDATQQRITELYAKAVEQLGHEKAPVRLGGLYALERLAQDNIEQRQTVVDVTCAYLRMPFNFDPHDIGITVDSSEYQELQVRRAAQSLLVRHLEVPMVPSHEEGIAFSQPSEPPGSYWKEVKLNLAGAQLIDIDFTLCVLGDVDFAKAHFRGQARFSNARFEGMTDFDGAKFYDNAAFGRAMFETEGSFEDAEFYRDARFDRAIFGWHGRFVGAKFKGSAAFNDAEFNMGALFERAQFDKTAQFCRAQFSAPNWFDTAQFKGGEPDFSGATVDEPDRDQRWPSLWQIEISAEEGSLPRLVRRHH